MSKIIGIDLGTTNSCVAVMEGGKPVVIANPEGFRTTPSIVAFGKNGERLVGHVAKRQAITNPENTIYSIKRFMGRHAGECSDAEKHMPYKLIGSGNDLVRVKIGDKEFAPPEISAMVLQSMKKTAEDYLGQPVTQAVITVPAYFSDSQRQATKDAGKIAGLDVLRIVNEPTAAALAYGLDSKKSEKVAVYDLGGGTFDISILEIDDGMFSVKATNGDTMLGGDNFDEVIIDWINDEFKKENPSIDLKSDKMALQRLKDAAEKAKIDLSATTSTNINLPFITADATGPKHLDLTLSRAKFDQLTAELVERTIEPCKKCLADSGLSLSDIDEVLLVGGSTRIPAVQAKVKEFFGKEPNKGVNPDEVVAIGAAVQGAVLSGDSSVKDVLLLDVTPLSLGIETLGGVMTKLIDANTTIPTRKSQVFSTAVDNQPSVEIHVLQGERPMAKDCKTLGKFHLDGITPAPRGVPQIEVSFEVDANGIMNVKAIDKATNKEQSIRIEASSGLSDDEIKRMKDEAEANAEADKKEKERIDKINQADAMIFQIEKSLKDLGDKIPADKKSEIENSLNKLKEAHKNQDIAAIDAAMNELNEKFHAASQDLYGQQGGAQQPGSGQGFQGGAPNNGQQGNQQDGNAQDVPFEEV